MDENSISWKIMNLWWILLSFIIFLNGFGLLYAGFKADKKIWKKEGYAYIIITLLYIILVNIVPGPFRVSLAEIYLLSWLISIIRSIMIRNKFLEIISHNKYQNSMYNKHDIPVNDYSKNNNIQQNQNTIDNNRPDNSIDFNTNEDRFDIIKVDINNSTAQELSKLPGINIMQAKKIIQARNSGKRIKSLDDLKQLLNLKDYQIEQLSKYIIINDETNNYKRRVDI